MIDIRTIVAEIVAAKDAADKEAFRKHVHSHMQNYGQNLLLHLTQAIGPEKPEEVQIVGWLQAKLTEVAKQIPGP